MKRLIVVLLILIVPTVAMADWGIEMSHRPIPVHATDNGRVEFHTVETGMMSLYWGDALKGRDNTKGGYWEKRYFVSRWEEPSKKYPAGRKIEEEVALGDGTAEDINTRNGKYAGQTGHVYSKKLWIKSRVKGVLPGWTNPNKGAGYTVNLNLMIGSVPQKFDIYAMDLLIGKRITIIPHLVAVYGKIGPSVMSEYWLRNGWEERNTSLGVVLSGGAQVQILKGIKLFGEAEFRGYGPFLYSENNSSVVLGNKFPFTEKEVVDHYKDYESNKGMNSYRNLMKESLRFGIRFTF